MKVKFTVDPKLATIIRRQFEEYARQENWWGDAYESENELTLVLTTGNKWSVSRDTLTYEGSRAGFHAFTPFAFKPEVKGDALVIFDRDPESICNAFIEVGEAELAYYHTSHPRLKWSERVVPLVQEPDKAVVKDPYGQLLRVIPYKNVYVQVTA
jgi:hypothetical protein